MYHSVSQVFKPLIHNKSSTVSKLKYRLCSVEGGGVRSAGLHVINIAQPMTLSCGACCVHVGVYLPRDMIGSCSLTEITLLKVEFWVAAVCIMLQLPCCSRQQQQGQPLQLAQRGSH